METKNHENGNLSVCRRIHPEQELSEFTDGILKNELLTLCSQIHELKDDSVFFADYEFKFGTTSEAEPKVSCSVALEREPFTLVTNSAKRLVGECAINGIQRIEFHFHDHDANDPRSKIIIFVMI